MITLMAEEARRGERRSKNGREWRIGTNAEIAWIRENTESGVRVTCAIPPVFEAYATLELAGSGKGEILDYVVSKTHDMSVLATLEEHTTSQPWWLGYLETGSSGVVFDDAPRVELHHWPYVLVEAGPEQARDWRGEDEKGYLPDVIFPTDRSWLFSTLWDDDWSYIGGSKALVHAFLANPELGARTHEVDPSMEDATPPGHVAF
jgi:hypothetical protein